MRRLCIVHCDQRHLDCALLRERQRLIIHVRVRVRVRVRERGRARVRVRVRFRVCTSVCERVRACVRLRALSSIYISPIVRNLPPLSITICVI